MPCSERSAHQVAGVWLPSGPVQNVEGSNVDADGRYAFSVHYPR